MDLQTLKYFVVLVEESSIAKTAERVHISQPALSRRFLELEEELGQALFVRGARKIELTDSGRLLYERAMTILNLVNKTVTDVKSSELTGKITIAAGESKAFKLIASTMSRFTAISPEVDFEIFSAHEAESCQWIDRGAADFALLIGSPRFNSYEHIKLPYEEEWGIIVTPDHPLAQKEFIEPKDLIGEHLMESTQARNNRVLNAWFGEYENKICHCCSYNLVNNALLLLKAKFGIILCINEVRSLEGFVFRPLYPKVSVSVHIVWRNSTVERPLAARFLKELRHVIENESTQLLS